MSFEESAAKLKESGNECVKANKYDEAVIHYTHAIKLEPKNYSLYSNRSFAFLKLQQYYLAMEDANQTISLNPNWAKGYFRKAEVELATFLFEDALISYGKALQLQPDDIHLIESLKKAGQAQKKDRKADEQIPWLGAGIGLVLGVVIVIADFVFTNKPTLTHPILMALLTIAIAMLGYLIAKSVRYYVKLQRDGMLQPPPNVVEQEVKQEVENGNVTTEKISPRYTKAQARQRYKKGKI